MRLFVLRHANSEDRNPEKYPDDNLRPLTKKGEKNARNMARLLNRNQCIPEVILTSPAVRALDTAVIFKKELVTKEKQFNVIDDLLPGFDREKLLAVISEKYNVDSLLIVGHEPDLSMLISKLLTGKEDAFIHLKKTGLCLLTVDNLIDGKCAILEWLIDPAVL